MVNSFVIRSDVVVITIVGCAIATIAPFYTAFAYVSNGSVFARVCLFGVIACSEFFCATESSLQVKSICLRYPILTPIGVAILVTLYVTVIDCVVFRPVDPDSIFRRHGFATAEIASVGTHPFLHPLLGDY